MRNFASPDVLAPSVFHALLAAALFGASTPLAKPLAGDVSPLLLAGLLYLGSGLGLTAARLVRDRGWRASGLGRADWPWLGAAVVVGGIAAPALLMFGLTSTSGAAASLLLNLEAVFTALLAWLVFKENADRRVVLGMLAIVAGSVALAWPAGEFGASAGLGSLAVAGACLCWAIDNNLTRKVSASDALFIAASKGLVAGLANVGMAVAGGASLPPAAMTLWPMTIGLFGYGISLVLFVLALRGLGAARTGAYFSTAPFVGAAVALSLLDETASPSFWLAAVLMGIGVWLHLTERHDHEHTHPTTDQRPIPIIHTHPHYPDVEHRHEH